MEARGDWFVPVLISDLRQTADKGLQAIVHPFASLRLSHFITAGKPSAVVDAVFHSSVKERCGAEPEFKIFLIRTHRPWPSILQLLMTCRAGVPTHRAAVQLPTFALHRDPKHFIKRKIGVPVGQYPALPLQPQRKPGGGNVSTGRIAELELRL